MGRNNYWWKYFVLAIILIPTCGFKLIGIDTVVLHEKQEIIDMLDSLEKRKDIGIIVVTNIIYNIAIEKIKEIENKSLPLIVKIPDRHGGW